MTQSNQKAHSSPSECVCATSQALTFLLCTVDIGTIQGWLSWTLQYQHVALLVAVEYHPQGQAWWM